MTKICSNCKAEKDITCFNKNCHSKDNLSSWCRDCQRSYFRAWQEKKQERHRVHSREYYRMHKAEYKAYRQANRERIITYQKAYRKFNGEYLNASRRLRRQKMRAKAAWDAAKRDRQQTELDVKNQLNLLQE